MNPEPSRREFLRSITRGAGLAGLLVLGGYLGAKSRRLPPGQTCINEGICRACRRATDCALPQALSFRARAQGGA